MKLAVFAAFFQAVAFSTTDAYPITGDGVNCRSGPGTSYDVKTSYPKGTSVTISCQTEGTSVNGNSIWDKTQDDCYVSDYYVNTGSDDYVTSKCSSDGGGDDDGGSDDDIPGPATDDYPYSSSCGPAESWGFFKCQCTSFVAWRINERLGIEFTNWYKGVNWGNANTWDEAADATGVTVDSSPVPGCIAQSNSGSAGHVAWVTDVGDDSVTVEEYNYEVSEGYGTRTVSKGSFNYIHVKV